MKVVAFNGSPRKDGNTAILLNFVLEELKHEGIDVELVQLAGERITGCIACSQCAKNKDQKCVIKDDKANDYIAKMVQAEGFLLGSPTYVSDITANMKGLIERCSRVSRSNGGLFKRKVAAAVAAVRRAGSLHAYDTLNHFLLNNQTLVPGSSYWNLGMGRDIGEVKTDEEGIRTMKTLGQNMAWLLKKIHG